MKKTVLLFTLISMFLYVSLANAQEYVVDDYTAALWHFNEGNGTIAHDETGVNNGTINGATWVSGRYYSALNFDGVNDYITIPDDPVLRPTNQITVEAWININKVEKNAGFIGKMKFPGYSGYVLGFGETSLLRFLIKMDGISDPVYVEATVPSLNTWHHIAGTYDEAYLKLYVDGNLVASKAQTGTINQNTDPLVIGRQYGLLDQNYFSGIIDEVRISNVARGISEPSCNCTALTQHVEQLEQRVDELENRLNNLTSRVDVLETIVNNLVEIVNSLTNAVNKIIGYLSNLPRNLKKGMICGYMKDNNLTSYDALGMHCQILNKRCSCQ